MKFYHSVIYAIATMTVVVSYSDGAAVTAERQLRGGDDTTNNNKLRNLEPEAPTSDTPVYEEDFADQEADEDPMSGPFSIYNLDSNVQWGTPLCMDIGGVVDDVMPETGIPLIILTECSDKDQKKPSQIWNHDTSTGCLRSELDLSKCIRAHNDELYLDTCDSCEGQDEFGDDNSYKFEFSDDNLNIFGTRNDIPFWDSDECIGTYDHRDGFKAVRIQTCEYTQPPNYGQAWTWTNKQRTGGSSSMGWDALWKEIDDADILIGEGSYYLQSDSTSTKVVVPIKSPDEDRVWAVIDKVDIDPVNNPIVMWQFGGYYGYNWLIVHYANYMYEDDVKALYDTPEDFVDYTKNFLLSSQGAGNGYKVHVRSDEWWNRYELIRAHYP